MDKIRRQDRAISEVEAIRILEKGEYGVLSMCSTENVGYGVPLNFVFDGNTIYFHCAVEGAKLSYLRNNNKVSFCVVGHTELLPSKFGTIYESVIVFGDTSEVEGEEKHRALEKLIEKYSKEYIVAGKEYIDRLFDRVKVVKLIINNITGKSRRQ